MTNTVKAQGDPGTSFLDDHIVGAAGLWPGTLIHIKAFGAGGLAAIFFAAIMAYYAPSLWRRMRQKAGSLQRSSTDAMAAEDAEDEAAMKRAAERADRRSQKPPRRPTSLPKTLENKPFKTSCLPRRTKTQLRSRAPLSRAVEDESNEEDASASILD